MFHKRRVLSVSCAGQPEKPKSVTDSILEDKSRIIPRWESGNVRFCQREILLA
jgi:hypothetical protein